MATYVDPTEGVHDAHKSAEVDRRVVLDRLFQERAERVPSRSTSNPVPSEPGNCFGWCRAYDTSELILPRELASVRQGHVDHVARDRDQRHGLRDRVEQHDDHRVGQVGVAARRPNRPR